MLLEKSKEHVYIVYTCNTYFAVHWSMKLIQKYLVNVLLQYNYILYEYFYRFDVCHKAFKRM